MIFLGDSPKVSFYPNAINKIELYSKLSKDDIFWIGDVIVTNNDYVVVDVILPPQNVLYSSTVVDMKAFYVLHKDEKDTNYICLGKTKGKSKVNPSSAEIKKFMELMNEEVGIYVQTNNDKDCNISVVYKSENILFDNLPLVVDTDDYVTSESIETEIEMFVTKNFCPITKAATSVTARVMEVYTPSELVKQMPQITSLL